MLKVVQKYFFFLIIAISSCGNPPNFNRPDVSAVDVSVTIDRFDQKFGDLKLENISRVHHDWFQDYPYFYPDYITNILEIGSGQDTSLTVLYLKQVLQDNEFKKLNTAVQKTFPSLRQQEKELTSAFKYIKYYFPNYQLPQVIAFVGGFSFQTPIGENYIGIGLDMFLGANSEFYPALIETIPLYISRRFSPENITPRIVETILREDIIIDSGSMHNTIQHMIYNGKVMYALDVLLEGASDEVKIGYTEKQLDWARHYQKDIWAWFIQENLLYSTDYQRVHKYFTEAPFTPELGSRNESAPKLGTYIGWMIVRQYMSRNSQLTLKELIENVDAQQILEDSKFKG